jgi:hypothetical protein
LRIYLHTEQKKRKKDQMHLLESSSARTKTGLYAFEKPIILTHPDTPSNPGYDG